MEKHALKELEQRISEKFLNALEQDDYPKASSLCKGVGKEFHTMHTILTNTIKSLMDELTPLISSRERHYVEDIEAEIAKQNKEKAREILKDKTAYYSDLHDIYVEFMGRLISYLYEYHRGEGLYNVLKTIGEQQKERFLGAMSLPIETIVKNSAMIMRSHPRGRLTIDEDSEKFTFSCGPCGSGGYLLDGGFYDPPKGFALIRDPQSMTWNNRDFPSYCVHCALWNEILPIEWKGYPYWVHKPPDKKNDPCVFYIYKDPKKIPKEHYDLFLKEGKKASPK